MRFFTARILLLHVYGHSAVAVFARNLPFPEAGAIHVCPVSVWVFFYLCAVLVVYLGCVNLIRTISIIILVVHIYEFYIL